LMACCEVGGYGFLVSGSVIDLVDKRKHYKIHRRKNKFIKDWQNKRDILESFLIVLILRIILSIKKLRSRPTELIDKSYCPCTLIGERIKGG
ncbi:MAG: hypothetical protein WCF03_05480, partial [Nitrososphaeraceae archaeon]